MKKVFLVFGSALLLSAILVTLAITGETVKDPVCGMEVSATTAYKIESADGTIYFCSQQCMDTYLANPSAYTVQPAPQKEQTTTAAEKKIGCEGCDKASASAKVHKAAKVGGCDGNCGQTRVSAINEFHATMMPLEGAALEGNITVIKKATTDLVTRKNAVMNAECPDGLCTHSFNAQRAEFGQKVDALAAAVQMGDDTAVVEAFNQMHQAYQSLDMMAR